MAEIPEERLDELRLLAARLEVRFEDFSLLDCALTHASALGERQESGRDYEALEFLGDAALGLAVADYLYSADPGRSPGEYSKIRAQVVSKDALARIAAGLLLPAAIRLGRGEERSGGRNRAGLWADCMESVIGALYLDKGWTSTREFVVRILREELENAGGSPDGGDHKSRLQQYCQAKQWPLPVFTVLRAAGPDHQKEFEVEVTLRGTPAGRGIGQTIKAAEQTAAGVALEHRQALE